MTICRYQFALLILFYSFYKFIVASATAAKFARNSHILSDELACCIFMCSPVWVLFFTFGISMGNATVMIYQLQAENFTSMPMDAETKSWIFSVLAIAGLPGVIMFPMVMDNRGRKFTFIMSSTMMFCSWIIFFFAHTATQIIIFEFIVGWGFSGVMTAGLAMIVECVDPKYRSICLGIKGPMFNVGMFVANTSGILLPWRWMALYGLITSGYALIAAFFWAESPPWLASKGSISECTKWHYWLKGTGAESKRELNVIIRSYGDIALEKKEDFGIRIKNFFSLVKILMTSKKYYLPIFLCLLLITLDQSSGRMTVSMYSLQIMVKITTSDLAAKTAALTSDVISIVSMCVGCYLAKKFNLKSLLLVATSLAMICLASISAHINLVKYNILSESNLVTSLLINGYFLTLSCGPDILISSLYSEVLPLQNKGSCLLIMFTYGHLLLTAIVKYSAYMFESLGIDGTFLVYSGVTFFLLFLVHIYFPETKNKTMVEIDNCFDNNEDKLVNFDTSSEIIDTNVQMKYIN